MWVPQVCWTLTWAVLQFSWQAGWLLGMWLLGTRDQGWWLGQGLKNPSSSSVPVTGCKNPELGGRPCPWLPGLAPFSALGGFYRWSAFQGSGPTPHFLSGRLNVCPVSADSLCPSLWNTSGSGQSSGLGSCGPASGFWQVLVSLALPVFFYSWGHPYMRPALHTGEMTGDLRPRV